MILKILGIKASPHGSSGSVGRVIKYITRPYPNEEYLRRAIFHNLQSIREDQVIQELEEHYQKHGKFRVGGNELLHVILSLAPNVREHVTEDIMRSLTEEFLETAFPRAKAFCVIHDAINMHVHCAVSANELESEKSTRLSKAELREVHAHMLKYLEQFPGLEPQIDMTTWGKGRSAGDREYYARLRSDGPLNKDTLKELVQGLLSESQSPSEFFEKLEETGYPVYEHEGEPFGVWYEGEQGMRKMRFNRMGVTNELRNLDEHAKLVEEQLRELEDLRGGYEDQELDRGEEAR